MANRAHLELLHGGVTLWNTKRPEAVDLTRADLRQANLTGIDLVGADLRQADLTGTHLVGAHLDRADLTGAHLVGAQLGDATLRGAHLRKADLVEVDLTGADLVGADLTGADLGRAYLVGADLTGAYLVGAALDEADLTGAYLGDASMREADLRRAKLGNAILLGAQLDGARHDATTVWPEGFEPPGSGEHQGRETATFERVEQVDEHGKDVLRWGTEPLVQFVSELLDDTSDLGRCIRLDGDALAVVELNRSLLLTALRLPRPDPVIIARAVAAIATAVPPEATGRNELVDALDEAGFADPTAAADAALDIVQHITDLGAAEAAEDQTPVEAIAKDFETLAELAPEEAPRPLRAAVRAGVDRYLSEGLAKNLEEWGSPKNIAIVVGAVTTAAGGLAMVVAPYLHYAAAALDAIYRVFPHP